MSDRPLPKSPAALPAGGTNTNRGGRTAITRERSDVLPPVETAYADAALPVLPSVDSQARALGWYADEVRSVNQSLGLYDRLPLRCQGVCCPLAATCPTAPGFAFTGMPCPLEVKLVYRHFASLLRDLQVGPEEHLDLLLVADLVRLEIMLRRTDLQLAAEGLLVDQVAGVLQKTCETVFNRAAHPLLAVQESLRRERDRLCRRLQVSRQAKAKLAAEQEKEDTGVRALFQRMREAAANFQREQLEARGIDTSGMTVEELHLRGMPGYGPPEDEVDEDDAHDEQELF